MPGTALARQFRARMLPLAALAGLTTALVPPAGFGLYAWQRHAAEARLDADQVARALHHTVERQGWLWRYNAEKIVRATVLDARSRGHATVRITDCAGKPIFRPTRRRLAAARPRRGPRCARSARRLRGCSSSAISAAT
jgi:hypothetical protein